MNPKKTDSAAAAITPALRIVDLRVQNIKRIRAVHIHPNGSPTVIVGGKNAQGKTSILDAIQMALGGAKSIPADPVRHGAKQGSIVADLGDLVVERVIDRNGATNLTVRDAEGNKQRSPQTILDALCTKIAFDPLAFMGMDPPKQNEVLRQLLGLDFTELDAERARCYDQRTEAGKNAKTARASSEAIVVPPDTPAEPVVVADLVAELETATAAGEAYREHERKLADAQQKATEAAEAVKAAEAKLMRANAAVAALKRDAPAAPPSASDIRVRLGAAEGTNRHVHLRKQRDALELKANGYEQTVEKLAARIAEIDAEKAAAIAAKPFPVPGLSLGEAGPMLDGVPLAQASAAQKLRVSVALGLEMNPRLKVLLVRDASLLDADSLALVSEMAAAAGAQVWLERVGDGDPTAVVISDGQVATDGQIPSNDLVPDAAAAIS